MKVYRAAPASGLPIGVPADIRGGVSGDFGADAGQDVGEKAADIGGAIAKLTDEKTWIRVGEFVAGSVAIFFGLSLLARELGFSRAVGSLLSVVPAGKAVNVAKAVVGRGGS
jgi:hypothetical protein